MDLLSTCVTIILIKFGMQPVFIVDFISIFFANILTQKNTTYTSCYSSTVSGTFLCQFVKYVRHNETSFSVLNGLHLCSNTSRLKHRLPVHSKVLCCSVSKWGKMWHGQSLMVGQRHIQHSPQNLLLRSVWSCYHFWPPKDHHCLPETLLPKMLVSKWSVSFIWIYICSHLQTNMWDAFQGRDSTTQNYVAFTWISSWGNVNKWGCIASQDTSSTMLLFFCECVMQGSKEKNNDWNKGAWIILWWSGGDGEELG